ncbi:MAG: UDP-glucuronate decarboxylase [Candidatus Magasanikbacteria bacterium GW2011_GWA2_45_39]|uniref:UDP-glucuronate decarboxylase n=1 Tax=Candidatus Magasanikbacteria bacterium GW2011_GWA2_45_39 TaxID=1619041 RepID=A0A0G1MDK4_9BACT|nr:MAG: UDP-glucuronate decarboxylase [Candidatus Magasanikbacteria bacterium GW2011_GWA2_45_39]HBW73806.1 NAD-dependent dehydratase [Candidatus Magasanikbacteria bacterium]
MRTILVTGGAGFIGSHLCEKLLEAGERVLCLDNLFTGSRENILHLENHPQFQFIEYDIIEPFLTDDHIDQIYNLACPASPVHYQHNPVRTIKANTLGVINVLGLARKHNARILQASTSEVYGDPLEHPQKETYRGNVSCTGPRACYDEGKRCAEALCFDYHRMHGMEIKVVRIFNTYGPRMALRDGRVVSNFIMQALKNEPITIDGDGSQTRSFCYVDDLVNGFMQMMHTPASEHGPINLGNPHEFTIKELAEKIIALTGSSSTLKYTGVFREDDPMQRCPDIARAREMLEWKPDIELEEGLKKTIEYFKRKIS